MLVGKPMPKPNVERVRQIKQALLKSLDLPEDAIITVSQLACLEQDCAPLETVIGLLRSGFPQLQERIHKSVDNITSEDLLKVSRSWGFDVQSSTVETHFI